MRQIIFLISVVALLFIPSCKKNQLGGSSIIKGKVMHHEKKIPFSIVYIKFNAKEFPGMDVNKYDSKITTDSLGNFSFSCYKGNYFLYGIGLDSQPDGSFLNVTGGIPVQLRKNEVVETVVPVTE